ncbi:MAG: glycosyltransferase [Peptococcaceae bacterium]|nr:glycosyltransferase [Peptococcaceae bacterium]
MTSVVIIPAYQPGPELIALAKDLLKDPDLKIIVIDDGSTGDAKTVIEKTSKLSNVDILKHGVNLGKGQALKTGFNHFIVNYQDSSVGVVTADADGQHLPEDIRRVLEKLSEKPDRLWLGCREFRGRIPLRSIIGNNLTRVVFRFISGHKIYDTQTGLRGIPRELLPNLLHISSTGYDYELEMLLEVLKKKWPIGQIKINTVYTNNNAGSHFNPLIDSFKIYFVFLRFSVLGILSAFLDYGMFTLVFINSENILLSTVTARVFSGIFNFFGGKLWVFNSNDRTCPEIFRYMVLFLLIMSISYGLVTSAVIYLGIGVYIAKVITESLLFFLSFAAQNQFVYGLDRKTKKR